MRGKVVLWDFPVLWAEVVVWFLFFFFTERSQQLERFLFQYPVTTNSRAP